MNQLALLVSPLAKGAYYSSYLDVAQKELEWVARVSECEHRVYSEMDFLVVDAEPSCYQLLNRLSFVQGLFEIAGDGLKPLKLSQELALFDNFVFGSKYKGKTNELLTQLLLNVGLASQNGESNEGLKLLDPMCGRGTTLMWALRYGFNCKGIEQDPKALGDLRQHVKKWCKLHRLKHSFKEGFIGKANKQETGKFIDFEVNETSLRAITGDTVDTQTYLKTEKFNLLVSDLPYGIQFRGKKDTRSPLETIKAAAPAWVNSLRKDGVMVLSFNKYMPKRAELISLFESQGLADLQFESPHRMGESIVRDVLVMRKI